MPLDEHVEETDETDDTDDEDGVIKFKTFNFCSVYSLDTLAIPLVFALYLDFRLRSEPLAASSTLFSLG